VNARASVLGALDRYAARWVAMHDETCEKTRVRAEQSEQVLDARMRCLEERLDEARALTAVLAKADDGVVRRSAKAALGLEDPRTCARAESLLAPVRPPEDAHVAAAVHDVRRLHARIKALQKTGKIEEALALAQEARIEADHTGYRPVRAEALVVLGNLEQWTGDDARAEGTLKEGLWLAEAERHDLVVARAAVRLVWVVGVERRQIAMGEDWARLAESALARIGGDDELSVILRNAQAVMLNKQGKWAEAQARFAEALAFAEKARGPEDPLAFGLRENLAMAQQEGGLYEDALHNFERVEPLARAAARRHPDLAQSLNNHGNLLSLLRRYDEAAARFEEAIDIVSESFGAQHPLLPAFQDGLAGVRLAQGDTPRARALLAQALETLERARGPEHPDRANLLCRLGAVELAEGHAREARELFTRAVDIWQKALGSNAPILSQALAGLGESELAAGQPARAIAALERAEGLWHEPEPRSLAHASSRLLLSEAYLATGGDRARAREAAALAHEVYVRLGPAFAIERARAEACLARAEAR
jgi:tetratricopeptide (TPR) repeat protein